MSNLGELVRDKVMENSAEKIAVKALAVAFIINILEENADDITEEEHRRGTVVALATCEDLQNAGIQISSYDLFLQAVKMLEE